MFGKWKKGLEFVKPSFYICGAMKAVRPYGFVVMALGLVVTVLTAAIIHHGPTAESTPSGITVRWGTEDESGVTQFVILRSDTKSDFVEIALVAPKGNYSTYEYVDRSVFKVQDRIFVYKIRVLLAQGAPQETPPSFVSYSISSAAKRTWGSIKAMFR